MADGGNKNVSDALKKIFTEVAALKLLPDAQAHGQFLDGLMGGIQKYLQMQAGAAAHAGQPGGAQGGMGGPGGGVGAPPNPGGPGAPPGMSIAPGGGAGMSGLMGGAPPGDLQQLLKTGAPG